MFVLKEESMVAVFITKSIYKTVKRTKLLAMKKVQ